MPQTMNTVSIGHLCEHFQLPYKTVLGRLTDAGCKAVLSIDWQPFFDLEEAYTLFDKPAMIRGQER